jgi:uncharacterized protein
LIEYDWDDFNREHVGRHRVLPNEIQEALESEPVEIEYEEVDGEPRWTSLGHTKGFRVLIIVWTLRNGRIRPITARTVGRPQRKEYLLYKGFPV